jgi:hypothetical protein
MSGPRGNLHYFVPPSNQPPTPKLYVRSGYGFRVSDEQEGAVPTFELYRRVAPGRAKCTICNKMFASTARAWEVHQRSQGHVQRLAASAGEPV